MNRFESLDDASLYQVCTRLPYPELLNFLHSYPEFHPVCENLITPLVYALLYQAYSGGNIQVGLGDTSLLLFCHLPPYEDTLEEFLERLLNHPEELEIHIEMSLPDLVPRLQTVLDQYQRELHLLTNQPQESLLYYGMNPFDLASLKGKLTLDYTNLDEAMSFLIRLIVEKGLDWVLGLRRNNLLPQTYELALKLRETL